MRALILMTALMTAACGPRPVVTTPPAACSALLPPSWAQGVAAEPIPMTPDLSPFLGKPLTDAIAAYIAAPYAQAYAGADGRLSQANGRTQDAILIVSQCEAAVNAARVK